MAAATEEAVKQRKAAANFSETAKLLVGKHGPPDPSVLSSLFNLSIEISSAAFKQSLEETKNAFDSSLKETQDFFGVKTG